MRCDEALKRLSLFLDDMLDAGAASEISRHIDDCPDCRSEYERLAALRGCLESLERVRPPEYFGDLLRIRLAGVEKNRWSASFRAAVEYRWSRIRTTESTWVVARALGATFALVLFFLVYAAMNQIYVSLGMGPSPRGAVSQAQSLQMVQAVLKNLGMASLEAQKKPIGSVDPKINPLYLLDFGQNAVSSAQNDTFSVVTAVDRNGSARIEDVIEYPVDGALLAAFNDMISSARCRPARLNGRAVDSILVLTFSKISVYD